MTRVTIDRIEVQQDRLQFGDPIGCGYHWTEPDEVDAYGDSVRRLAGKVELAVDGFARTATLSEEVFAGEAADALRTRAANRHEEAVLIRDNLRGLSRAINAYCDVLRRHREGLEQLRADATGRGLDVRGHQIWPPVETIAGDAPPKELDAWERDWKGYRECFETKIELRDNRRIATRELIRALADHADVHPDKDRQNLVASGGNTVSFGELRREAAEEAMEAVQAGGAAEAAQRTVEVLKRRELSALDSLETMVLEERPPAEIQAQAEKVATIHRELTDARVESREAESVAEREQSQANVAARNLEDSESGRPRAVSQAVEWQPHPEARPGDLRKRLG